MTIICSCNYAWGNNLVEVIPGHHVPLLYDRPRPISKFENHQLSSHMRNEHRLGCSSFSATPKTALEDFLIRSIMMTLDKTKEGNPRHKVSHEIAQAACSSADSSSSSSKKSDSPQSKLAAAQLRLAYQQTGIRATLRTLPFRRKYYSGSRHPEADRTPLRLALLLTSRIDVCPNG